MIYLAGPGGAGKTTVGLALGRRLGLAFVDLDEQFTCRAGDISAFLARHGYPAYATLNIQICIETVASFREEAVLALSSGFMTYPDDAYPGYRRLHQEIDESPRAAVLLPSFDCETCAAETVRRQLRRPFARSADQEEYVIRARFPVYWRLRAKKFDSTESVGAVVENLVAYLAGPHRRAAAMS